MEALIIGIGITAIIFTVANSFGKITCSYAHKQSGLNYIWLNQEFGNVLDISYEEPVNFNNLNYDQSSKRDKNNRMIGNWKPYTDEIWEIHCDSKVIDHCNNLVENHVSSFINPNTRFARLRFTIQNHEGQIIEMEPTVRFYELEQNFFNENICKD